MTFLVTSIFESILWAASLLQASDGVSQEEVDGKGWASVKYHSFRTLHNTAQTFDSKVSFENSSHVDDSLIFSEIVCEFASASICERKGPNFRA